MYLWVCMKYAWLDQLVLPNKKCEKSKLPMHVLHIAQVHGGSTDASSNGQTWYNRGERHIPSNTRQEQLWQRSSKLALFWPTIQFHHLLCQGKLHKSEKRATSSGGKSCFTSSNLHIHVCSHSKRRSLKKLQVGVLQVALVTLGRHIGLLNNWYCLPEENEVSDRF